MKKFIYFTLLSIVFYQSMHADMDIPKISANTSKPRVDVDGNPQKPTYIILHYTAMCTFSGAVKFFQKPDTKVSAHYVVGPQGEIVEMVDPELQAAHAGVSSWKDKEGLNVHSIGIEIVNPGYSEKDSEPCSKKCPEWSKEDGVKIPGSDKIWYKFTPAQIETVIQLCKHLMEKYNIPQENVIGHGDIAPGRKVDPGPLFPWKDLCQHDIGICPENIDKISAITNSTPNPEKAAEFLKRIGYKINSSNFQDPVNRAVLIAFQMHFKPDSIDGILDSKTYSILEHMAAKSNQEVT
ncbi:MAG TPA: N-acetylmuramoyl-L-alanine amidase [Candidatus Saccharimonadales bacterium]|nr:N-acetylmuramoyl-L-alanine amidase [Candidatus Saccharimonadales bacterium]